MTTYFDILKKLPQLKAKIYPLKTKISVVNNLTLNPFNDILNFFLLNQNIQPKIEMGNYDNVLQDAERF
jgi:hypothetical protein